MEVPARLNGIGAIIALVCVIFGVLIIADVVPPNPVVLGSLIVGLGVARLT